ncbi:GMC family oxidoreductase N-terminal domain-containing protein [uncultured Jannaschia sp.]|uniref:GMC family oxidoreductase n=1 Tax=uncultured Jannaschia sp. TaxID=293347 RepID=UPI00262C7B21|nr:GMC family oxidoreductase N-terminal domain-containing protein [uncultured Jannaschia sp.]
MAQFDYIIIGAGSAGCVLAEGLSRNGRYSVLVLEAGSRDRSPWIALPIGYGKTFFHPTLNWRYSTESEEALGGRSAYWPRGKVLGGSSAINALVYVRGLPGDFDDWVDAGAHGWDWNTVAPVFETLETRVGCDGTRDGSGPMHVQDVCDQIHPATRHFFAAADEMGLPRVETVEHEGATSYRITTKGGRRCSAARAFLRPAMRRANVTVMTRAAAERLIFEGRYVTGVEVTSSSGKTRVSAGREVIVAAGAVASPLILQRSGIGPAATLRDHGIDVLGDSEAVGGHLQDHLGVNYFFRATEPTLNQALRPLHRRAACAIRYALTRRGPLALSVNQCGGFFRSRAGLSRPDQQLYFNPVSYMTTPEGRRNVVMPDPFPGFIIGFQPARPSSRGRIDISGPRVGDPPRIRPNSLSTDKDRREVVDGARFCQRLASTGAMRRLIDSPIAPDLLAMEDDEAILTDFRARCGSVFHPVGTCRMGADPSSSVVDPRCRVHGVGGLRVVDASVFPSITSGNTNAPTMMVARRAADMILEDA